MPSCSMVYRTTFPAFRKRGKSNFCHRLAENSFHVPATSFRAKLLVWCSLNSLSYIYIIFLKQIKAFGLYSRQNWQHYLANNQVLSPTNTRGSAQDKTQEISISSTKYILLPNTKPFRRKEYSINTGMFPIWFRSSNIFIKFPSPPKENCASLSN